MKKKSALTLIVVTLLSFCGCTEEYINSTGGGSCLFVNHNTKDSVLVSGGIHVGSLDKINVHSGDLLEMTFIPDPDYVKYNYDVVYTLMDGTRHSCGKRKYTYKFTVSDWGSHEGEIAFSAHSTDKNANIVVGGAIKVTLLDGEASDDEDRYSGRKATVDLTYVFSCDSDLVRFVTPEIIYTDKSGENKTILDESQWSPITYAFCSYTENGTTHYEIFTLEEGGGVPEPWQIEETYSCFDWTQVVELDKIGVTNHFVVRYHRKPDYEIEKERTYEMGHKLRCTNGHSSFVSDEGKIIINTYNPISIDIGGKTTWHGDEVQEYITELCSKNDTVSVDIDDQGKFTLLSEK